MGLFGFLGFLLPTGTGFYGTFTGSKKLLAIAVLSRFLEEESVPTAVWLATGTFATENRGDLRFWCSQVERLEFTRERSQSEFQGTNLLACSEECGEVFDDNF